MSPEEEAEIRREFFDMVEALELATGPDMTTVTSIAVMACCRARLMKGRKPLIGVMKRGEGGISAGAMAEVVRGAIDDIWDGYAGWSRDALELMVALCLEHLDGRDVDVDVVMAAAEEKGN